MNQGIRPFQIALIAVFLVFIVIGLLVFVLYKPSPSEGEVFGDVQIWGTLDATVMRTMLYEIAKDNDTFNHVSYQQIDERDFEDVVVNAIAEGRSPDLILIPHTDLVKFRPKLAPISYDSLSARDFKDRFIDGGEIYLLPDGVYTIPLLVDPLVLYWNRDILASNSFAAPPQTWESIVADYVPTIVERDFNRNILLSPIGMGEYRNVNNAFALISTLMMQGGSRLVSVDSNKYTVDLDRSVNASVNNPLTSALQFYTSFATANNPLYSWNRAISGDQSAFVGEKLALYFGLGSEYKAISRLNPNLNFDIADMPQSAGSSAKRTYGDVYGLALLKAAPNPGSAYTAIGVITSDKRYLDVLYQGYGMAPAERSLIAAGTTNPVDQVRYRMAVIAHGWLNPDLPTTEAAFQQGVEDILSLRSSVNQAVRDTVFKITEQLR